mmetsp:Transcript_12839/g.19675  ORF Transcript_12839/g.19675 Transcript_12839/m.19675 type:complete len:92 (-) Transcript_12839:8-283(-)
MFYAFKKKKCCFKVKKKESAPKAAPANGNAKAGEVVTERAEKEDGTIIVAETTTDPDETKAVKETLHTAVHEESMESVENAKGSIPEEAIP